MIIPFNPAGAHEVYNLYTHAPLLHSYLSAARRSYSMGHAFTVWFVHGPDTTLESSTLFALVLFFLSSVFHIAHVVVTIFVRFSHTLFAGVGVGRLRIEEASTFDAIPSIITCLPNAGW
jgi:hypothetical protein